jgi:ATP-dependent Clp protease ATP-binding subunit ClpC
MSHKHIGTEHLLLGMLREEKCFAAEILNERGLRLSTMREELAHAPRQAASYASERASSLLEEFSSDLTRAALDNELDPLIGRTDELQAVLHALGGRNRNSVVLLGEAGVGKTAIVDGLALWIAAGNASPFLADKRLLAIDMGRMAAGANHAQFASRMNALVKELTESHNPILFIRELTTLVRPGSGGSLDALNLLRPALSRGEVQCITEAATADYEATLHNIPWFASCSRTVSVSPLSEEEILIVLDGQRARFEKYHSVSYTDEALQCAARYASGYPAKAIDMVDAAGTMVKLRQAHPPEEIHEVQKRIRFIVHRMENSIANHEFEKARFYSDEERKERENLQALREKYRLDEPSISNVVRLVDMESAISRAGG